MKLGRMLKGVKLVWGASAEIGVVGCFQWVPLKGQVSQVDAMKMAQSAILGRQQRPGRFSRKRHVAGEHAAAPDSKRIPSLGKKAGVGILCN